MMKIDSRLIFSFCIAAIMSVGIASHADETCNSPYMSGLIKGQEDFVHVWTLGVPGMGDGSDKLVTIDANPTSKTYGKVIHKISVGGRGEAHHMGFTPRQQQDLCLRCGQQPFAPDAHQDDQ
jgi:selenium-binding protein 1